MWVLALFILANSPTTPYAFYGRPPEQFKTKTACELVLKQQQAELSASNMPAFKLECIKKD